MPDTRRSSRGRHRAPATRSRTPISPRLHAVTVAQCALALGLVLSLGGYTVAESVTQRESAAAEQRVDAAAGIARDEVIAGRERAAATAADVIATATAARTEAAGSMSENELAPLDDAVAVLMTLIGDVPDGPAPIEPGPVDAADLTGTERASRGVTRAPVPVAGDKASAAPSEATDLAGAFAASDTARAAAMAAAAEAAQQAAQTSADGVPPADELAAGILAATAEVADLTAQAKATAQGNAAAQVAAAIAAEAAAAIAAQAEQAAAEAAESAAQRASLAAYANGRVPADALCAIGFSPDQQLRCDAAEALTRLNDVFRAKFGTDLAVTDSYRSYSAQVACARSKGRLCAAPGTSNHGRGVAIDLGSGVQRFGSAQHEWMADHAGEFGWDLPDWASRTGSKREPWHWEFTA